jgi:hypothetical protein
MRIGTIFLGRVGAVDGEAVATKFFMLGVPVVPLASYYFTEPMGLGALLAGGKGFEIPTNATSVFAGYARVGLFMVAALLSVTSFDDERFDLMELATVAPLWMLWLLSQFVLGRLSSKEKLRRRLLRAGTGVGAPPQWMGLSQASKVKEQLEQRWYKRSRSSNWRGVVSSGAVPQGSEAVLYSLCEYSGESHLGQQVLALAMRSPSQWIQAPRGGSCPTCGASIGLFSSYEGGLCASCAKKTATRPSS